VYNESENVVHFLQNLAAPIKVLSKEFDIHIMIVDNCSSDDTVKKIISNKKYLSNATLEVLTWVRNYGVMTSIYGGLCKVKTDAAIVIDFDLQDSPNTIVNLVDKWKTGVDFVYGSRRSRNEPRFYYPLRSLFRVLSKILRINSNTPVESGLWLMSQEVIQDLRTNPPISSYLAGTLGIRSYKSIAVTYDRDSRQHGSSKFSFTKYLNYAADALLSNPRELTRIMLRIGLTVLLLTALFVFSLVILRVLGLLDVPSGLPFLSVLQILLLFLNIATFGIIGQYISALLDSVARPSITVVKQRYFFAKASD
jgi:glycosyltransferase involved in cell wall biosynthesis